MASKSGSATTNSYLITINLNKSVPLILLACALVLQEDLIGEVKERKRDHKVRDAAHHEWLDQQDARDMAKVVDGIQRGFRQVRKQGFGDDEVRRAPGGCWLLGGLQWLCGAMGCLGQPPRQLLVGWLVGPLETLLAILT